jgi:citrate lyase subunit beta / citryl-CoA lyase
MTPTSLLRSLLFVPGDDQRKLDRAADSNADAVVLDWEDSVLPERKVLARNYCSALERLRRPGIQVFIRINSFRCSWFGDDVKAVARIRPDGIVIPKCQAGQEIHDLVTALRRESADWEYIVCPMIESPVGLLRAEEIATASEHVSSLGFGAQDFCSSMGIRLSKNEPELLMARCTIVAVARANELAAIDSPSVGINDLEAVRNDAERSVHLGFTGKFAIHPRHIASVAEAFVPTLEEVTNAEEIIQQRSIHETGAFAWKGQMIDEAILEKARRTLQRLRASKGTF